ncbi:type IV toxin-antitoxin system AbiEi family antitoxin domain-containing protein [Pseudonocardia alni]|uniref:type IV toxin-antitoxin system AbiEi family antitoxin domain-containing protein n=1 Tax=Pseudonocardia alni TaxID=33907 RepID=UPI001AD6C001|nr:type IV toxin-antitoxin system AbiEi family antitoxin domain-containing protein [Pseudonocardia alni]MBO4240678.1 hypothetical protein [Pseudonocardia alni]
MEGPFPDHGVRFRADLRAAGVDDGEIGRALRRGELVPIRRGAYLDHGDPALVDARGRHRAAAGAALDRLGPGAHAGHVSALVLLGIAFRDLPLDRVHVTRDRSHGGRRTRDLHVHPSSLPRENRGRAGGLPAPVLQWPVQVDGLRYRADFAWPEHRVVGPTRPPSPRPPPACARPSAADDTGAAHVVDAPHRTEPVRRRHDVCGAGSEWGQWQLVGAGGTSRVGLRSKNPAGFRTKPV